MGPPGAFQASDRGVRLSRAAPKKIKNIKCYRLEPRKDSVVRGKVGYKWLLLYGLDTKTIYYQARILKIKIERLSE